jgi:hypothetical protein
MDGGIMQGMTGQYYGVMVLNRWFVSEYYRIFHNSIPHISFGIDGHGSIVSEFSLSWQQWQLYVRSTIFRLSTTNKWEVTSVNHPHLWI